MCVHPTSPFQPTAPPYRPVQRSTIDMLLLPSVGGMQALAKRVVDLTCDVSALLATKGNDDRKILELELDCRRKSREKNRLRTQVHRGEAALNHIRLQYGALTFQLAETSKLRLEEHTQRELETESLSRALRESESQVKSLEVTVDGLKKQSHIAQQVDFQEWLEGVILRDEQLGGKGLVNDTNEPDDTRYAVQESNGKGGSGGAGSGGTLAGDGLHKKSSGVAAPGDDDAPRVVQTAMTSEIKTVRDMVTVLLEQWREHVGFYPKGSSGLGAASKPEQKFLQRICDLVTSAHEKCTKAFAELRWTEIKRSRAEMAHRVISDRLRTCVQHLHTYRKRAFAAEAVANSDYKHQLRQQGQLNALLKKALSDLRESHMKTTDRLLGEKRDKKLLELKGGLSNAQIKSLQSRLAEVDSRGTSALKAKEDALASLEARIKDIGDATKKWFKNELPRLISGLPVTEDALKFLDETTGDSTGRYSYGPLGIDITSSHTDGAERNAGVGLADLDGVKKTRSVLNSSNCLDRTYVLAQALCAAKAQEEAQQARITSLEEKNYILRDKLINMEGVILKWRDDMNESSQMQAAVGMSAGSLNPTRDSFGLDRKSAANTSSFMANLQQQEQQGVVVVYDQFAEISRLQEQLRSAESQLTELEETSIEYKGRCEHAVERADELKVLLDSILSEEQLLKTRATQQITRIRIELENRHAIELRELRETYEKEKTGMSEELSKLAIAFSDMQTFVGLDTGRGDYSLGATSATRTSLLAGDKLNSRVNESIDEGTGSTRSSDHGDSDNDNNDGGDSGGALNIPKRSGGGMGDSAASKSVAYKGGRNRNANASGGGSRGDGNGRERRTDDQGGFDEDHPSSRVDTINYTAPNATTMMRDDLEAEVEQARSRLVLYESQLEAATRSLEIERTRSAEARNEVAELEHMMKIQRAALERHLSVGELGETEQNMTQLQGSFQSSRGVMPSSNDSTYINSSGAVRTVRHANERQEDSSLWPSLGGIIEELIAHLHALASKHPELSSDGQLRAATGDDQPL